MSTRICQIGEMIVLVKDELPHDLSYTTWSFHLPGGILMGEEAADYLFAELKKRVAGYEVRVYRGEVGPKISFDKQIIQPNMVENMICNPNYEDWRKKTIDEIYMNLYADLLLFLLTNDYWYISDTIGQLSKLERFLDD